MIYHARKCSLTIITINRENGSIGCLFGLKSLTFHIMDYMKLMTFHLYTIYIPFIYDFCATSMICITKKEINVDNLY